MKNKSETPGNKLRLIRYKTESLTMVKPNIFEKKITLTVTNDKTHALYNGDYAKIMQQSFPLGKHV